MPYYWEAFCSFKTGWEHTWTDYMICPPEKQAAAADYYTSRRHVAGFEELLDFTPCSLWPLIRRALFVMKCVPRQPHMQFLCEGPGSHEPPQHKQRLCQATWCP